VISPATRVRLAARVRLRLDPRTGKQILLWPERGLELNDSAARIAALCKEPRTVDDICERMAAVSETHTSRARIEAEVVDFLRALDDRGLLEISAP
jgi:coenzyme PQQ biosynthesis protein PqqD